jgi:hypothetical protein
MEVGKVTGHDLQPRLKFIYPFWPLPRPRLLLGSDWVDEDVSGGFAELKAR